MIWPNLMVDLETLDNKPTAAIVAIGAVLFTKDSLGETFYCPVTTQSSLDLGLTVSGHTVEWWMLQSDEARKVFHDKTAQSITTALQSLSNWLRHQADLDELHVWGNGASFDNAILAHAYGKAGLPLPWRFWNDRCYRTAKADSPHIEMVREGTHHNALNDAVSQTKHLQEIWRNNHGLLRR